MPKEMYGEDRFDRDNEIYPASGYAPYKAPEMKTSEPQTVGDMANKDVSQEMPQPKSVDSRIEEEKAKYENKFP